MVFCAFDVLFLRGKDLRLRPLGNRLDTLKRLLSKPLANVLFMQHLTGKVQWLYQQALALQLEGVVAKRLDSPYLTGQRSSLWLKIKRPGAVPAQRFQR